MPHSLRISHALLLALLLASPLRAFAQTPTADNRDTLIGDLDSDTQPDRGDTIRYDVQVSNPTLAAALMLMFSSTLDANQSFVAGSLNVSPLARDDAYDTPGNTLLEVGVTPGGFPSRKIDPGAANDSVLDNDQEFLGDAFTLTTITGGASTNGGTVNLNADGTFTYLPPLGFAGTDTFTYTIRDDGTDATPGNADDLLNTGTVTITVGPTKVWYVNNTAGAGDGRSTSPFNSLAAVTGATGGDAAGDIIYVHAGGAAYAGGMVLLNNQTFHGQNVALVVGGNTIQTAGGAPTVVNAGGHAVTLAQGNTVQGMALGSTNAASFSLFGNAFGSLTVSSCSINNASGGAASLTTGTPNVTLSSLNSAGSTGTAAVNLDACGGSFSASGGTITAGSGPGWRINGGTVASTYSGSISQANNAALVSVSGGHATGAVLFQTGALGATNGTGLQFDNADSTAGYAFNGTVTLNGGDAGIDIANGSAGVFSFTNAPITNPTGAAFVVNGGNGNITHFGTISKSSAGRLIDIQSRSGGTITISGNLSSTSSATGITVSGCASGSSVVVFSGGTKTLSTGANAAVTIANNSNGTRVDFTNGGLDIDTTTGTGISAITTGQTGGAFAGISVQGANNTIDCSSTGTCLFLNDAPATSSGMTFLRCVTASGQVANINTSSGTKTLGRVSTSSGGTTAMTLFAAGTVEVGDSTTPSTLTTSTGTGLSIGGTTLNLVGTGAGAGLDITTTGGGTGVSHGGATTSITGGGLDILTDGSTDGPGLVATSGGTFSLTGSNNTVSSGNRTAINIANTAIGASGVTFRRVDSSGGTETGIILDTTGSSGGLTVTGDGSNTAVGGNASGGVIATKTGANGATSSGIGAYLRNTSNVVLRRIHFHDFSNYGIRGFGVNNLVLEYCTVDSTAGASTRNGDDAATNEASVQFGQEEPGGITGLTGTATIDSCVVADGFENNFDVFNVSGSLSATVTNTTIRDTSTASPGNNGLQFKGELTAAISAAVTNCSFLRNRANGIQAINQSSGTMNMMVGTTAVGSGGTYTDNNIGVNISNNGSGALNFNVLNGTFTTANYVSVFAAGGAASQVNVNLGGAPVVAERGAMTGNVSFNSVNNAGSTTGPGMRIITNGTDGNGGNTLTIKMQGNSISNVGNFGIEMVTRDGNSTIDATLLSNTVQLTGGLAADAIRINAGATSTAVGTGVPDSGTINLDCSSNDADTSVGSGIRIRQRFNTTFRLENYGGSVADDAAVATYLSGRNPLSFGFSADHSTGGSMGFLNTGSVTEPPAPMLASSGGVTPSDPDRIASPGESIVFNFDDLALDAAPEIGGIADAATSRWAGTTWIPSSVNLAGIRIEIADLPGDRLAEHAPGVIRIDIDAVGHGWFVDPTPMDDSEFPDALSATRLHTRPDLAPAGRMDLLSVILHEMGHALGLEDDYSDASRDDLMHGRLAVGERRLPARRELP